MNSVTQFEDRASRSRGAHEGESSQALCDRLSRTRATSQRQLPTDHDYAVSTREYQTDQSSLKSAPTAAGPVLDKQQKQRQRQKQKQPQAVVEIDRVTPYQGLLTLIRRQRREQILLSARARRDAYRVYVSDELPSNRKNLPRPCGLRSKSGHPSLKSLTGDPPQPSDSASSGPIFPRNAVRPISVNRH
jgi:hypothetical protein